MNNDGRFEKLAKSVNKKRSLDVDIKKINIYRFALVPN